MEIKLDGVKVIDQDEEMEDEIVEQMERIKRGFVKVLQKEDPDLQVIISVLASMYVTTACDMMELPKEIAINAIVGAIELRYSEDETGEGQCLN